MINRLITDTESLIYPGIYHPSAEIKLPRQGLDLSNTIVCKTHTTDNDQYLKLEIEVPVVRREDIFIYTYHQILSITVLPHQAHACSLQDIVLPSDVDPSFGSAEFKNGILSIYFLKHNLEKSSCGQTEIIVY